MPETALYPTVKRFMEAAGFEVKGEVCGCDIVAVRNEEPSRLAIVEMKLGFSLDLLLQAVDRIRAADEVWVAVPATSKPARTAGQRTPAASRRSVSRRVDRAARNDGLSAAGARLRRDAPRRSLPAARPTGRSIRCRPDPTEQCLWLV
jgi:hypothetical protein